MDTALRIARGVAVFAGIGLAGLSAWWAVGIWDNMFHEGADASAISYLLIGLLPASLCALCVWFAVAVIRGDAERALVLSTVPVTFLVIVGVAKVFS